MSNTDTQRGSTERPLIDIVNVTKSYKKGDSTVTPLADLNLQVKEGEFVFDHKASDS